MINRDYYEYFGEVSWANGDIKNAFEVLGYEFTSDDVAEIRDRVKIKIEDIMTEAGWDCICNEIYALMRERGIKE